MNMQMSTYNENELIENSNKIKNLEEQLKNPKLSELDKKKIMDMITALKMEVCKMVGHDYRWEFYYDMPINVDPVCRDKTYTGTCRRCGDVQVRNRPPEPKGHETMFFHQVDAPWEKEARQKIKQ